MTEIKELTQSRLDSMYAKYIKNVMALDAKGYDVEVKKKEKFKLMYDQERRRAAREKDKKKSVLRLVVRKSIILNKKQKEKIQKYFEKYSEKHPEKDINMEDIWIKNLRKEYFNTLLEDERTKEGATEAEAYSAAGAAYNKVF